MKCTQKSFYISFSQHFCSLLKKILIICHYLFNKHIEPCDIYWGSLFLNIHCLLVFCQKIFKGKYHFFYFFIFLGYLNLCLLLPYILSICLHAHCKPGIEDIVHIFKRLPINIYKRKHRWPGTVEKSGKSVEKDVKLFPGRTNG